MRSTVTVAIHRSQFPEKVRRDLLHSLRTRAVQHKFHYDSVKQAQKWLALHAAFSPSRIDPDGADIYDRSFAAVAAAAAGREVIRVIGLGCGDGWKEARLLRLLGREPRSLSYIPCDVSVPLVLVAQEAGAEFVSAQDGVPLVCDLGSTDDLSEALAESGAGDEPRIVTCFGLIPNFEPQSLLPRLAGCLRRGDELLLSANLAPGADYLAGVQKVFPQYANELTADWLLTFLLDLGVERNDGKLDFVIEDGPSGCGLRRIAAYFGFERVREIGIGAERFQFQAGERVRLFFSYRHTLVGIQPWLAGAGIEIVDRWLTQSGEEGVFLCRLAEGRAKIPATSPARP